MADKNTRKKLPKIAVIGTRGIPAYWGGIERKCEEIYSRLAAQGFSITIYTRPDYTNYKFFSYKGVRLKPIRTIRDKHLEPFVHTFLCTIHACFSDAQIIHYYAQGPCLFSWIPRLLSPRKKVVFSCCGLDWKRSKWNRVAQRVIKIGEWLSAKATHARISVSLSIADYYRRTYDREMCYIPNGTNEVHQPKIHTALSRFGLEPNKFFVFIGRLVPEKAIEELIEAYQQVRLELPGIKLAIVGGTSATDSYVSRLKQQAGNDSSIVFTSYVFGEALSSLYANALAYVTPSHLEGLPNSLLEAISHGTPVIASDIEPHIEIIHPPGCSPTPARLWVFKAGCIKELSLKLYNFYKLDVIQRKSIGSITKETVCNYYTWDQVANTHSSFYKKWQDFSYNFQSCQYFEISSKKNQDERCR